jgi:dienelactone hydrolase
VRALSAALIGLALGIAGCGSDERLAAGAAVPFQPGDGGAPSFGDVPWPSDLYLMPGGGIGPVPGLERIAEIHDALDQGLASLDGFGLSTASLFFVNDDVDSESLPRTWEQAASPEASLFIVDIDDASPQRGTRYPVIAKYLSSLGCISALPLPGVSLAPGDRHALVLTTRVQTVDGRPFVASAELARVAGLAPAERKSDAERLYGDALDTIEALEQVAQRSDVASLSVFTTSRRVHEIIDLRARLREQPEPTLILDPAAAAPYSVAIFGIASSPSLDDWLGVPDVDENGQEWPGGDNPGGIAHSEIGAVASGAFVAPSYRDATSHHFERDASGAYVLADPNAKIPVTLMIPKQQPPPSGYPVVINGHGLSNNRGSMLSYTNELARAGFAVIGIDDVEHGARAGLADEINNYPGTYQGPDGIPDQLPFAISFFAGLSDFVTIRDNFRQTVLDETSLVRLIESSKLDLSPLAAALGGPVPKLDPKRIYWCGGSLGGIMGAMTIAVEPEIRAAALQVPGAGFVDLIATDSAKLSALIAILAPGAFGAQGEETLDEFHPVVGLIQAATEAGDPIAYAPHVMRDPLDPARSAPDVMVSYAVNDEVLPNIATLALIRALGLELATPKLVELPGVEEAPSPVSGNLNGRTGAAVQYAPANHGLGYGRFDIREYEPGVPRDGDPRFPKLSKSFKVEMAIREHDQELVEFFQSAGSGKAVVEVTAPPVADFDGDGVPDDLEQANGTDPWDPSSK